MSVRPHSPGGRGPRAGRGDRGLGDRRGGQRGDLMPGRPSGAAQRHGAGLLRDVTDWLVRSAVGIFVAGPRAVLAAASAAAFSALHLVVGLSADGVEQGTRAAP
eukprot:1611300-Pyramimonas_sp.AAC.1